MYYRLNFFSIHHVQYTPFICGKTILKFEILNFQMYIFWIFKVLEFHIFEIVNVFLMRLIGYYHFIFCNNLLLLYESFESPL
jgi:hypothetical protein